MPKTSTTIFTIIFCIVYSLGCNKKTNMLRGHIFKNSKTALAQPYLILISLDGFRWDYVERFQPPNLLKFINKGVQAESLIPCFPSKTFPNHYSVATGMYPDHHGLVDNSFYNFDKKEIYKISNRQIVQDGTWYGGTPIWVQAAKSGMVTASYFFVGSEADVQGIRPSYYYNFDRNVPNKERVQQALDWLKMPAKKRPHLITMYFSDMDDMGHSFGPNNDAKLKDALFSLDTVLGDLFNGVKRLGLPVNIIIVSDHGMLEVPTENYMPNESIENEELYHIISNGAIVHVYPKDISQTDSIYDYLKSKENHFKAYKTADTPQFEIVPKNKNWGSVQVVPDKGWYFTSQRNIGFKKGRNKKINGEHGFDSNYKELHGILYANGPAFKNGHVVPSVKNIHIYPVMCEILGLDIPKDIDGELKILKGALK